jgi:hypothetical protein
MSVRSTTFQTISSQSYPGEAHVPDAGAEISVVETLQSRYGWLTIPLESGGIAKFEAAVTFLRQSQVRQDLLDFLIPLGLAQRTAANRYLLRELTISGHHVADLEVGGSTRLTSVPVDGVFGFPFLRQFSSVNLDVGTLRLTLVDP